MAGKGNALKDSVLNQVLGGPDYVRVSPVYIALFTATPSGSGGGTEVTGGSYARQSVPNDVTNWPNASGGNKTNGTLIDFGTATANWGTVGWGAIMTALTGGVILYWGALTSPKTINQDDGFRIPIGGLTLTES